MAVDHTGLEAVIPVWLSDERSGISVVNTNEKSILYKERGA
jgi:hypothetical protein